ncbi:MAG: hypothetical protein Q9M13_06705 [Mariprofundales bacterium]|nr:hypothetical protein [Mariprofundales bacterium]
MRISSIQPYNNLLQGITQQQDIRTKANANIAAGTRFQTPAQAGLDYKHSLDLRQMRTVETNALTAVGVAERQLRVSQTVLMDMEKVLARAQVLAVQQSSATYGPADRKATAVEVRHLLDQLKSDANQQYAGEYLFAGTATDTAPWSVDLAAGSATYNGSKTARTVRITETQSVVSSEVGDDPAFSSSFKAMIKLINGLESNTVGDVQAALGDLNAARNQVVAVDSRAGAKFAALQSIKNSHQEMKTNLDKRINTHEAVDVPKLVSDIQLSDIALQASYKQISTMSSLSLVNFLR